MKGLILNRGEEGYSYFKDIFCEIKELSEKYNWLISYPECCPKSKRLQEKMNKDFIWVSGLELKHMLCADNVLWIWGVFSGFSKNILPEDVLKYPLPYADGYTGFWKNPITLQHPLAEIELVAWDSCCTLFISKDDTIIKEVSIIYPLAEDLVTYNEK